MPLSKRKKNPQNGGKFETIVMEIYFRYAVLTTFLVQLKPVRKTIFCQNYILIQFKTICFPITAESSL